VKYTITNTDGLSILALSGEIDLHYSPDLRKAILDIYKMDVSLEVDLSNVQYLDSSGVACFVEAFQISKNKNLGFVMTNISQPVMQVIKLARLDSVFPIK